MARFPTIEERKMKPTELIELTPLGGLGEFGKNCMLLKTADTRILIDCGGMFPDAEHPGVDLIVPDFRQLDGVFLDALVLTHGHEDHIAGVPHLLSYLVEKKRAPIKVYGTPFTLALVTRKLEEFNLLSAADLIPCKAGKVFHIKGISVEPIHVNHSIPDSVALAIRTPSGLVYHSGDWRIDHTPVNEPRIDLQRIAEIGREGVYILLADSTNSDVPGSSVSEARVGVEFEDVMDLAPGRVLVTQFSSNIGRLQSIVSAATETGRRVALIGRALRRNASVARETGHLELVDPRVLMSLEDVVKLPDHEVVIVVAGSQGEPFSSLTRIAAGEHPEVRIKTGDWVVYSSRKIPGNEKRISYVVDQLIERGAKVLTPGVKVLHTTGHALADEQKLLLNLLRPRFFVPAHGSYRQLDAHRRLGEELELETHVFTVGETLTFVNDKVSRTALQNVEPIYVVEQRRDVVDEEILRQRRQIAAGGFVIVTLLKTHAGKLAEVLVLPYGVCIKAASLVAEAKEKAREAVVAVGHGDDVTQCEAARLAVRRFFKLHSERKPFVIVEVSRIPAARAGKTLEKSEKIEDSQAS
ncbi:MAG: hypothetical protein AUK47_18550 [Deltaproteobacteria bacterium CG2_30_63_29]|nr:MAG: hypothetical protein AUK47_18550 [Deltaproteobacteria bacterium CG2_30_63_29]PJB43180.1 MAG: ribonuclease J [Deltaproteobacteria bacterium CG_4_9_14_3_um_filter_63_12]